MRTIVLIFFIFSINNCFSQKDTVVNGKTYNYIEYYKNGNVKILGRIKDSLRVDKWKFYHSNNSLLAIGKFKKGRAKGKWKYYSETNKLTTYRWNWRKDFIPITTFKTEDEKLIIKQHYVLGNGRIRFFHNGQYRGGFRI